LAANENGGVSNRRVLLSQTPRWQGRAGSGKGKDGLVLPDQRRTRAKTRRVKRLGKVEARTMTALLRVLTELFAQCDQ
jgi:mRNA-degrading endonuclease toxin of MazEF toxin-antitoxin module